MGHEARYWSSRTPFCTESGPYRLTEAQVPTLSIEATLEAPQPLTVCSWHTILHPRQALQHNCFEIIDKSTNTIIPPVAKKAKRPAIQRQVGNMDEQLFITLMLQVPYTIPTPFGPPPIECRRSSIYPTRNPFMECEDRRRANTPSESVGQRTELPDRPVAVRNEGGERRACERERRIGSRIDCSLGPSEEPSPLVLGCRCDSGQLISRRYDNSAGSDFPKQKRETGQSSGSRRA